MRIDISNAWRQLQRLVNDSITLLPNLLLGVLIFGLFYVAGSYVARLVRSLINRHGHGRGVGLLIGRLAHYVVMTIGLLVALSTVFPSFKANDLIQVLGIGGVAVGFAFKDIFQNFLAGIIILISRPFRIGDQIVVKNYEGYVEDIQTRATVIRTYDNKVIVVPNTVLFTEEVTVITAYERRRTEIEVGIGVSDDFEGAIRLIKDTLSDVEGIEKEPAPDALLLGLGESTANLRVRWWTRLGTDVLAVKDRALRRLIPALLAAGFDMPFPTTTILFGNSLSTSTEAANDSPKPSSGPEMM